MACWQRQLCLPPQSEREHRRQRWDDNIVVHYVSALISPPVIALRPGRFEHDVTLHP